MGGVGLLKQRSYDELADFLDFAAYRRGDAAFLYQ